MIELTPDKTIKIEWNPTINKYAFPVNAVGAHAGVTLIEPDYTDTDANTIYVSADTGADGNAGTFAAPKATLVAAIEACTEVKTKVVIIDSATYIGELNYTNVHFQKMYKNTGETPIVSLRDLGYVPADANSIFVSKTGSDANAGTQAAPKLTVTGVAGVLSVMDAAHQNCVFLDSGTYDEEGWEITGNKLNFYAAYGCTPTINLSKDYDRYEHTSKKAETVWISEAANLNLYDVLNVDNEYAMFLFVSSLTSDGSYYIYSGTDYLLKNSGTFKVGSLTFVKGLQLLDSSILVLFTENAQYYYTILSHVDYSVTTAATIIPGTSPSNYSAVCQQTNGNIITFMNNGANSYYKVFNSSMGIVTDATTFGDGNERYISCAIFANDNILVAYYDAADGKGKYLILSGIDFSIVKAETVFADFAIHYGFSAMIGDDNNMVFCYAKTADNLMYQKFINGVDYSERAEYAMSAQTTYAGAFFIGCRSAFIDDDIFVLYTTDDFNGWGKYYVFQDAYQLMLISASSIWNGITLTTSACDYVNKLFDLSHNLFLSWCTIHGLESPQTDLITYVAHGSFKVDTNNCDIHDNDAGYYLTTNAVTLEDSVFYRCGKDYAVYINGAAAASGNITIEHLTVYNNYRGVRLENNNGTNEIVKNCIFSANNNFGLQAETAITLTYAILLDATSGVTNGTGVILANPLYVNDGLVDETATDLHVKLKVLGYITNSPAYNAADDSRDLGAYWIEAVGEQTTWSSMTLTKPEVIPTKREYSGAVNVQLADGSYDSYKEGQSELVELKWKGVTNDDFDDIDELWCCDNNSVRVYFNPTSDATVYWNFTLLRQPMNAGVEQWLIDSVAKQDVSLFLARTYEHI